MLRRKQTKMGRKKLKEYRCDKCEGLLFKTSKEKANHMRRHRDKPRKKVVDSKPKISVTKIYNWDPDEGVHEIAK